MRRRQFAFWMGFGLFNLGERLGIGGLDNLAAATMRLADEPLEAVEPGDAVHWTSAENSNWRWFERENLINGRWKLTGITTPINKYTLERYEGRTGYLDDNLVPAHLRSAYEPSSLEETSEDSDAPIEPAPHTPDPARKARHGRPPSKWLRSLNAEEIRVWLQTIDVPEAGVSGMTYWTHLTRDHSFDAKKIEGLSEDEQAKLHAAAHFGY